MSEPTISVYVSTLGAPTLRRLLDSIAAQRLIEGDQVVVVVDRQKPAPRGPCDDCCDPCSMVIDTWLAWVQSSPTKPPIVQFVSVHHEDHCWGHPQRNWLLDRGLMTGDLIVGNDDDDVFNPGAFDAIRGRAVASPGRVLLFRFVTPGREVLWQPLGGAHRGELREGRIGGHCIVVPNVPERIGRWGRRYQGDWDFIQSTLALNPEGPVWCPEVISTARPGEGPQNLHGAHDLRRGEPGPDSVARVVVTRSHGALGQTLERILAEQRPGDEVVLVAEGPQTPALSCAVDLAQRGLSVLTMELPPASHDDLVAAGRAAARAPRVEVVPEG